jgi:hypothetical protein
MNEALRKVCRANLLMALDRLKQYSDPSVVAQATMAEALFRDFESSEKPTSQFGTSGDGREYNDNTNYEKYKLLRSFGLSPEQLVDVANADGLHELRVIRMLRIIFELSLDEATRFLNSKKTV